MLSLCSENPALCSAPLGPNLCWTDLLVQSPFIAPPGLRLTLGLVRYSILPNYCITLCALLFGVLMIDVLLFGVLMVDV